MKGVSIRMDNDQKNPNPCPVCHAEPFEKCYSNGFPGETLPHVSRPAGAAESPAAATQPPGSDPQVPPERRYVVLRLDSPWVIARKLTGSGARWKELVAANPQKSRSSDGSFTNMFPGEVLNLPKDWLSVVSTPGDAVDIIGEFDFAATLVRAGEKKTVRTQWTAIGLNSDEKILPGNSVAVRADIDLPFRAHYLIVTSPGFFIEELRFGNDSVLHNVPGDAFLAERWDGLERLSALERVRLDARAISPGVAILAKVVSEHSCPAHFRAVLIGEEICS
jgi:hypothetical protein